MTWQSDHRMGDYPMIDETLPDEPMPAEDVTAEPLPAESVRAEPTPAEGVTAEPLPAEPVPAQPLPAQPLPAQPLPAQPLPAQVMTDEQMTGAGAMESHDPDLVIADSGADFSNLTDVSNGTVAAEPAAGGRLSEQWHDIQAMFVDDPQGSVERAAQEAEAAVSALVESLRQRQAALAPAGSSTEASDTDASDTDASDTEQLRTALRGYRVFCERLVGLQEQLRRTGR